MSEREERYKAVIGPKNQEYYLRHFERFDDAGKAGATWNWSAALFSFFWFIYRRMWLLALGYVVAANVLTTILILLFGEAGNLLGLAAQMALPGMFANALYYRHCTRMMAAAEASGGDLQSQLVTLAGKGGTGKGAMVLIVLLFGIVIVGMLAAIAIPQYQVYSNRARLSDAAGLGRQAVASVDAYRRDHAQFPETLGAAGFAPSVPPFVYGIEMDGRAVVVTIRQGGGFPNGGSLTWDASEDAYGKTIWKCTGRRIPESMLPTDCR